MYAKSMLMLGCAYSMALHSRAYLSRDVQAKMKRQIGMHTAPI